MGYFFQICASFQQICGVWIKPNKPGTTQELIVSVADKGWHGIRVSGHSLSSKGHAFRSYSPPILIGLRFFPKMLVHGDMMRRGGNVHRLV